MSSDLLDTNQEDAKKGSIVTYRRLEENSNYILRNISLSFVQIQQLKTNLNEEHQHAKHTLIDLNEKLRLLVDHTRQLESGNSQLIPKLSDLRQSSIINAISEENDQYNRLETDMLQVSYEKTSYDSELEIFQLESQIYQQMIEIQQQSLDEQKLKLEQLLNQSVSDLASIRTSCGTVEQEVQSAHTERENTFQKYMTLAKELSILRKQTNEYKVNLQMMRTRIKVSKAIMAKLENMSMSIDMSDFTESWKLEWAVVMNKIRYDFEVFYAAIHQETICFYENKTRELEEELEQIHENDKIEETKYTRMIEQLQWEHEEVQKVHSNESAILLKSQTLCSQLESDWKTMQIENQEKFEAQSNDFSCLHENFMATVISIEEMKRKKIYLESEIIIYRHILGKSAVQQNIHTALTTTKSFSVEVYTRGSINLECPIDGTQIKLMNQSANVTINISRWHLKRLVDSKITLDYILPDGLLLQPGNELRIYSKLGSEITQASLNESDFSSPLYQKLILSDVYSIGIGEKIETLLCDENGEEKASCLQSMISN